MTLAIKSRHIDMQYAVRTLLASKTLVSRSPVRGNVLFDAVDVKEWKRDFEPQMISFPELYAYHVRDVTLGAEYIAFDAQNVYVDTSIAVNISGNMDRAEFLVKKTEEIRYRETIDSFYENTVLIMHNEGGGTWGHFLAQNLPRALLFLKNFPYGKVVLPKAYAARNNSYGDAIAFFGIRPDQIITIEREKNYRFRETVIMDFLFYRAVPHPLALELLEAGLPPVITNPQRKTFIPRSSTVRLIENHEEIENALREKDFGVFYQKKHVSEQIETWRESNAVIGTLGSDLTNIVFGSPGTKLIVISPNWFGDRFFFELAAAKGMQWNEIRCGRGGQKIIEHSPEHHRNFFLNAHKFLNFVDSVITKP